ncbi:MAG: hypothetical protein Ct9H300mP30_1530 [Methanobacteriota archaeon]|nr:MAG: hypothetical protein Ct9H300mP30_1530 [Euryarchaeota archaeon]
MAKRAHGGRQGTRSILKKKKVERSRVFINRVMHPYAEGDHVAIVLDGAQQKGMPHPRVSKARPEKSPVSRAVPTSSQSRTAT